ncbi:dTDP-4-dehydrorhamnose 3,5-epimerase family protein [Cupriavidus basilensis]|uniref:dTDP-4-dehydrorhamnose 3,5-epimerase n=1 Tax=Cupriavidus basilensis TaxID=68895 RepID=A0ABT6AN22_9BURK|nr:dTDP-4-dehydrorhamnose 3,5-epimerase family protein [Cupriavidus basilensis]MDF3834014.1 dTDP-4-dehydrorhamnose 3,5-epimerase family protein [Cupriavidus basilensis]
MRLEPLALAGCFRLLGNRLEDSRGDFFKLFHAPTLAGLGLETDFTESFVSTSRAGVIRGMHFQRPPKDHAKLVCCLSGRARDGLVDLRPGSPTFGASTSLILSADAPEVLYVPRGVAHGFAAHVENTQMWYLVSSVHDPAADAGVHVHGVGIDWWTDGPATVEPILSARDQQFPALDAYLANSDSETGKR